MLAGARADVTALLCPETGVAATGDQLRRGLGVLLAEMVPRVVRRAGCG